MSSMDFTAAYQYLLALPRFDKYGKLAYKPGLERMDALLEAMGHPETTYPSVLVAGTNGKGSTASMLAAIGTATGRRIGLHTSPHLVQVTERMRIDGCPAPEDWFAARISSFKTLIDRIGPSFFEITAALSLLYFAEEEVDWAIVEVGLGGRLDATNVLNAELAIITNIGFDHTDLLGHTLTLIAKEKAGIIKSNKPVLTGADQEEALAVIRAAARSNDVPCHCTGDETKILKADSVRGGLSLTIRTPLRVYQQLAVGLAGKHQIGNAVLAVRAAELLFAEVSQRAGDVFAGLRDVRRLSGLRGRLDILQTEPLIVADVGHNAEGLAATLDYIVPEVKQKAGQLFVLFGVMRDKEVLDMMRLLADAQATVFLVILDNERAKKPAELKDLFGQTGISIAGVGSVSEGQSQFLEDARINDALLITGSHQVVAQLYDA